MLVQLGLSLDNNITEESPRTPLFFSPQITQISADED